MIGVLTPATIPAMEKPAQSPVSLSVSIVLFRTPAELLQRTLDHLAAAARQAAQAGWLRDLEVFLVDNTPAPERADAVLQTVADWPQGELCPLHYHRSPENLGFGAGNNSVLPGLDSDYHLVLNPDVELAADALVAGLAKLEADARAVLVSPPGDDGKRAAGVSLQTLSLRAGAAIARLCPRVYSPAIPGPAGSLRDAGRL